VQLWEREKAFAIVPTRTGGSGCTCMFACPRAVMSEGTMQVNCDACGRTGVHASMQESKSADMRALHTQDPRCEAATASACACACAFASAFAIAFASACATTCAGASASACAVACASALRVRVRVLVRVRSRVRVQVR
jgi:hypothetical protein